MASPDLKNGPSKFLSQPLGGGTLVLFGEYMDLYTHLNDMAYQSDQNCGKHVLGGGFNSNRTPHEEQLRNSFKLGFDGQ